MATKYAEVYLKAYREYRQQKSILEDRKDLLERRLERLNKRLEKLYLQAPSWIDTIIKAVADDLILLLPGRYYEILGPFGLGARTSIHFYKNEVKGISGMDKFTNGNCLSITFLPTSLDSGTIKVEDSATDTGEYNRGTLGELNGFNHPSIDIPDDADAHWFLFWVK